MPGNKEKANLKLQIRNTEEELWLAMDKVDEITEKVDYLRSKLKRMESSGQDKKQKSQKK